MASPLTIDTKFGTVHLCPFPKYSTSKSTKSSGPSKFKHMHQVFAVDAGTLLPIEVIGPWRFVGA